MRLGSPSRTAARKLRVSAASAPRWPSPASGSLRVDDLVSRWSGRSGSRRRPPSSRRRAARRACRRCGVSRSRVAREAGHRERRGCAAREQQVDHLVVDHVVVARVHTPAMGPVRSTSSTPAWVGIGGDDVDGGQPGVAGAGTRSRSKRRRRVRAGRLDRAVEAGRSAAPAGLFASRRKCLRLPNDDTRTHGWPTTYCRSSRGRDTTSAAASETTRAPRCPSCRARTRGPGARSRPARGGSG